MSTLFFASYSESSRNCTWSR